MKIDGIEIKVGNILEIDNKLWRVLKTQHTQPGKGGAYIQAELKEIKEGTKMNSRFRSSESVERAILDEKKFQYLYEDNQKFIFMDQQSYEQIELGEDLISKDQPMLRNSKQKTQKQNVTTTKIEPLSVGNEDPLGMAFDSAFTGNDEELLQSLYERESDPQRAQIVTNNKQNGNNAPQDFQERLQELENSRGYSNSADSVKTIEEQQREWRENVSKADDKAESEAKSRHIVKEADKILSVISRDNVPLDNGEFNQNTPFFFEKILFTVFGATNL